MQTNKSHIVCPLFNKPITSPEDMVTFECNHCYHKDVLETTGYLIGVFTCVVKDCKHRLEYAKVVEKRKSPLLLEMKEPKKSNLPPKKKHPRPQKVTGNSEEVIDLTIPETKKRPRVETDPGDLEIVDRQPVDSVKLSKNIPHTPYWSGDLVVNDKGKIETVCSLVVSPYDKNDHYWLSQWQRPLTLVREYRDKQKIDTIISNNILPTFQMIPTFRDKQTEMQFFLGLAVLKEEGVYLYMSLMNGNTLALIPHKSYINVKPKRDDVTENYMVGVMITKELKESWKKKAKITPK